MNAAWTPRPVPVPSSQTAAAWTEYWSTVGNEDWLTAKALIELSPRVRGYFATYLGREELIQYDEQDKPVPSGRHQVVLDWQDAAGHLNREGLSSTEHRLARLVLALTTDEPIALSDLARMGSWSTQVWRTLTQWGTDGAYTATPLGPAARSLPPPRPAAAVTPPGLRP
jgi:hypothetical protein